MVRSPCCDKMGLKKGPWTPQEDQVLVSYILQHGHGNWRALPKHAGLLRCGKSCRLRWTNYLRPDIKRGNFSREEEETIIELHEQLGNKWSAIAARLPGRTDNEIKNVWHTHLKKRLKKQLSIPDSKGQSTAEASSYDSDSFNSTGKMSPQPSSSDFSSGTMETQNSTDINNEQTEYSPESFPVIDESFWSDELSSDDSSMASDFPAVTDELQFLLPELESSNIIIDDGMDFWYDVFIGAGGLQEL